MLFSCKKEDPVRSYNIEDETRQWTAFKKGSYWIYQEQATGRVDSTYVVSFEERQQSGYDENGNKCLAQELNMKFASLDGTYTTKVENKLPRGNSLKISMFDSKGVAVSAIDMIMVFPLSFMNQTEAPYFSIISEDDKISLEKEVIRDVVHVKCTVKGLGGLVSNQTYENEYWIAKNRWIVRLKAKSCLTGQTEDWVLKRYKIVQ